MTANSDSTRDYYEKYAVLKNSLYFAMSRQYGASLVVNLSQNFCEIKNITDIVFEDFGDGDVYSALYENLRHKVHSADILKYESFIHKNLLGYFADGGTQTETEYRLKCADGEFHWIKITAIRLRDIDLDSDIYAAYLLKIIDDRKAIERSISDALLAAEAANKAKSEFLNRVSHDIRTPMNAVINLSSIVRDNIDTNDSEKALEYLNKLEISSEYLLSLINNILDMSRIESGKIVLEPERFDLYEFIDDIKTIIAPQIRKKNQEFRTTEVNIADRLFFADTLRLKQILINLLSNAVKFTSRNGTISLETEQKKLNESRSVLIFTVSDTGIGMSQKLMNDMFKPFVQGERLAGSYEGSGLGLPIVHNLVSLMNGTINVYSELGIGTEIIVEIPAETPDSTKESSVRNERKSLKKQHETFPEDILPKPGNGIAKNKDSKRFKGKTLLLAEDDFINAEIACLILGEFGFSTDTVCNGEEAVNKFNSSPVSFYDGILMDLQMPLMDGYDAAKAIRSLPRADAARIPIIALSANIYLEDIAASKAVGMNAHVAKPINAGELIKTLENFI